MKNTSVLLTAFVATTLAASLGHSQPPPPPGGPPPPPPTGAPPPPDPNGPPPPQGFRYGRAGNAGPALVGAYSRRGTIKAFNAGPEGETNGLILNDGTVVLFPPEAAGQLLSVVKEGSRVTFAGFGRTGALGRMIVTAQSITANGQTFTMPSPPDAQPGPPPPPGGPPPPPGGRERGRGPGGPPPPTPPPPTLP